MKNYYLEHILESYYSKGYTSFLNGEKYLQVKSKIPSNTYNIFKPYNDANKVIIYKKEIPDIVLCKITCNTEIKHQIILKELFNMGLKEDMFGDIIIDNNIAYIYIFNHLYEDILYNFKLYNTEVINIEKINLEELSNYEPKYQDIKIIVSSLRMDNIISKITNDSRKSILERFKNKEIIKNYQVITKYTTNLQVGDIFSIRKYGKYRFDRIEKITKSGGYIINIRKYL